MAGKDTTPACPLHMRIASQLLLPASAIYGLEIARRNRRFDAGVHVHVLDVPVISIGNITMGGTGKTPMCGMVIRMLRELGHTPALAMRGYRAKETGGSDEAAEYADAFPDLPMAVGADRVSAIRELARSRQFNCVVLDDGFQHRRIARDLDVVLIDATRSGLHGRLIPAGRLREPTTALSRADAVLVTRSPHIDEALGKQIEILSGKPPTAWFDHVWESFDVHVAGKPESRGSEFLKGLRLGVSLGVGNPSSILAKIAEAGGQVVWDAGARDHHRYTKRTVEQLRHRFEQSDVKAVMVTPKDWVSIRRHQEYLGSVPIVVPRLQVKAVSGIEDFSGMIASVFKGE